MYPRRFGMTLFDAIVTISKFERRNSLNERISDCVMNDVSREWVSRGRERKNEKRKRKQRGEAPQ